MSFFWTRHMEYSLSLVNSVLGGVASGATKRAPCRIDVTAAAEAKKKSSPMQASPRAAYAEARLGCAHGRP